MSQKRFMKYYIPVVPRGGRPLFAGTEMLNELATERFFQQIGEDRPDCCWPWNGPQDVNTKQPIFWIDKNRSYDPRIIMFTYATGCVYYLPGIWLVHGNKQLEAKLDWLCNHQCGNPYHLRLVPKGETLRKASDKEVKVVSSHGR